MYGVEVYQGLPPAQRVPIGLVQNQWGGTLLEAWMDPEALAKCAREPVAPRRQHVG